MTENSWRKLRSVNQFSSSYESTLKHSEPLSEDTGEVCLQCQHAQTGVHQDGPHAERRDLRQGDGRHQEEQSYQPQCHGAVGADYSLSFLVRITH